MITVTVAAIAVTGLSALADYRRRHRADIDRVGFMPWPLISIAAVMIALFAAATALKS